MGKETRRKLLTVDAEDAVPELSVVAGTAVAKPAGREWLANTSGRTKEPHAPVKDLQNLASRFGQTMRGETVVEIETDLIDPSFISDRLEITTAEIAELADMIREKGQMVPILVRTNPKDEARYQIAFGHRRWRAAKLLGIKVKAVVRELTDIDLVVAQGQENNARSDLSFIEKARFATKLEDSGFSRKIIGAAVGVHDTGLSTMIGTYRKLPEQIVDAIGKAPNVGRPRWTKLQQAFADPATIERVYALAGTPEFQQLQSEARFSAAFAEATKRNSREAKTAEDWLDPIGRKLIVIDRREKKSSVHFDTSVDAGFADYVVSKLNDLYRSYATEK